MKYSHAVSAAVLVALSVGRVQAQAPQSPSGATTNPASGDASDNIGGLQEIIVTAQKRSENAQRVPIAITAVSPDQLTNAGVQSLQDLGSVLPGMSMLNVGSVLMPRIRGVGSTASGPGNESPVAAYIDGVYHAFGSDIRYNVNEVQQISALYGPQGTLFGRNATGGVLQITTREPEATPGLELGQSLDNYLTSRTYIYATGGLANDLAGNVFAAYATQSQGWGENLATGSEAHRIKYDASVRAKFNYTLEDTSIKVSLDYANAKNDMAPNYRPFPGYNLVLPAPQASNPWSVNNYVDTKAYYRGGGASVTVDHDFGFANFVSISAYRNAQAPFYFNAVPTNIPSLDLYIGGNSEQVTQEFQLVSNDSGPIQWATGLYYFWNTASTNPYFIFLRGIFEIPGLAGVGQRATEDTNSIAGFAQGTWAATASTRLTLGLRYTHERRELVDTANFLFAGDGTEIPLPLPPWPLELTYSKPTWRISVDQDLADNVLGYVSYNRGFKSGGYNSSNLANPPFEPEQLDAFEMGVKSEFLDRRVRLNGAAYYYDYKNMQVAQYTTTLVILNAATAKVYGLDANFEANITDAFEITGGVSVIESEFTSFPEAPISSVSEVPGAGVIVTPGDASGNEVSYAPDLSYTLGANYRVPAGPGQVTFNITDSYSSGYYAEPDNKLAQGSYHLLSASVHWDSDDGKYRVTLFGNNLLDEAVISQFGAVPPVYYSDFSNPPRIYGARVQLKF